MCEHLNMGCPEVKAPLKKSIEMSTGDGPHQGVEPCSQQRGLSTFLGKGLLDARMAPRDFQVVTCVISTTLLVGCGTESPPTYI